MAALSRPDEFCIHNDWEPFLEALRTTWSKVLEDCGYISLEVRERRSPVERKRPEECRHNLNRENNKKD